MADRAFQMFDRCRCAALCAVVCSIVACVPTNPTWSSPDPASQSSDPEESASTYEDGGDDHAEDGPATAANEDQADSTTATGYAPPGKTCAAACRRFAKCKLYSYEACMEECGKQGAEGTAEGRRTNLVQARSSCKSLAAAMGELDWVCIAEGESIYGYNVDTEGASSAEGSSSVHLAGKGKTRADAEYKAVSDCGAMMSVDLARNGLMNTEPSPRGSWGSAISTPCHIIQCIAPAREP
jgi:hypothetical protein